MSEFLDKRGNGTAWERTPRVALLTERSDANTFQKLLKPRGINATRVTPNVRLIATPDLIIIDSERHDLEKFYRLLKTPHIVMSSDNSHNAAAEAIENGAENYIFKPFDVDDVQFQVVSVLRKLMNRNPAITELGSFKLNSEEFEFFKDGRKIDLTLGEFRLVSKLMSNAGQTVPRDELLDAIDSYGSRTIDVHVNRIREKVEVNKANPQFITTVRGVGYRFDPDIPSLSDE